MMTTFIIVYLMPQLLSGATAQLIKLPAIRCTRDVYGNRNCTCPEDPITEIYVNKEARHCETYYLCHLGQAIVRDCGDEYLAFHPQVMQCMPRIKIDKNLCPPEIDCPEYGKSFIEDTKDCTKYYMCQDSKHFRFSCDVYQYFDPVTFGCKYDRSQYEVCVLQAKRNAAIEKAKIEKPPPKSSHALDAARRLLKNRGAFRLPRENE